MDRGIHLHYGFEASPQAGEALHNPLFELLQAVHDHGSIRHAAAANGVSYRYVWGQLKRWELQLGVPLVHWTQGQPARLTADAERLLWAERRARARLAPQIDALRAELGRVLAEALDGPAQSLVLAADHEPPWVALRTLAAGVAGVHVELRHWSADTALQAVADGRALLAAVSLPADPHRLPGLTAARCHAVGQAGLQLVGALQRATGLMVAPGNPHRAASVVDLVKPGLRFAHREPGSGVRELLDLLRAEQRLEPERVRGWADAPEPTADAVAAAIASGRADAGPGTEAVAAAHGLDFVPLVDEVVLFAGQPRAYDHPAVQGLLGALRDPGWAEMLGGLPGTRPWRAGECLGADGALVAAG